MFMRCYSYRLVFLVAVGLAVMQASGFAGQRRRGAAPKVDDSPLASMSIEELRGYQGYFFSTGGRDPMVMRLPTDREMGLEKQEMGILAPTYEEMERDLVAWLGRITESIKIQNYDAALSVGNSAITVIDNEWPAIKPEAIHLIRMSEDIRNYSNMAARLKSQQDVGREFSTLGLRVDGISWSPTDAKAVVNGVALSAGELLLPIRRQGDLRVETIEEYGVVFQFQGMRFRIPIQMYN